jgi:hypothetical protein
VGNYFQWRCRGSSSIWTYFKIARNLEEVMVENLEEYLGFDVKEIFKEYLE